jgi:pimeloyl-ACP methyl ester carboxylesterase
MRTNLTLRIPIRIRVIAAATSVAVLTSCATGPGPKAVDPVDVAAAKSLQEARSSHFSSEERVGHYLDAAKLTAPRLGSGTQQTPAVQIYNAAAAELTITLRSENSGQLWNRPLTITGEQGTYRLQLQPAGPGVWSPDFFTSFEKAEKVEAKLIKRQNEITQQGVGGALVGVRQKTPREKFSGAKGFTAPVTATVEFSGSNATIALRRPAKQPEAKIQGTTRPLAADFSAPIGYYRPPANLLLVGLLGGIRGENYAERNGLFLLEPYDPDRIPVVFVHGLFSTPFTWVQTINGLQQDPELRKRYQFWVFSYNTGNPILYSALQLRERLAEVDKTYPNHKPYVVVGHSMGGMLTHAQVVTVTAAMWEQDKNLGSAAKSIFATSSKDSLVVRSMTFHANPRIKRVVYVCTPHRGSDLATSGVGKFGISLIRLPLTVATAMTGALTGAQIEKITGTKRLPNSVSGLRPSNPALPIVNAPRMTVPYHSIIGDRGKGGTPNSTDGVVAYWSSHLDGAKSECIVPGPHSSCELPQTVTELDRILKLHLKTVSAD